MKIGLLILSLAFATMPARAMLRPCMKTLMQHRNEAQMYFLRRFFDATQDVSKIKNVFFVTHQFDDRILSRRLQELQQCGVPVYVLVSHALAYGQSLPQAFEELHASDVWIRVFNRKYDDVTIEIKSDDVCNPKDSLIQPTYLRDQHNNMSLLLVKENDSSNGTLVLQSGSDVSLRSGHQQFEVLYEKIDIIFHDEDESEELML